MFFQLSAKAEYGLMMLKHLAALKPKELGCLRSIAKEQNLPIKFLERIASDLLKAGLVISQPGSAGGYRLKKSANQIKLSEILSALGEDVTPTVCKHDGNCCKRQSACPNKTGWLKVQKDLAKIINAYRLSDLIN
ncbi:Rrf2 family transcriptional regulator [Patescibacteria group bacterium]|nr:Rrf2 family transcriptional regulator [Patescibacteria group bacterium]